MGLRFDNTTADYINHDFLPAGDISYPFSMAGWYMPDTLAGGNTIISVGQNTVNNRWARLMAVADGTAQFSHNSDGDTQASGTVETASGQFVVGEWGHICGYATSSQVEVGFNGVFTGSPSSHTHTVANIDEVSIGTTERLSRANFAYGVIAEAALWVGYQITSADAALLAAGYPPILIAPQYLKYYATCRNVDDYADVTGGVAAPDKGTPLTAEHPLMLTSDVNITPNQATANHTTRSRPVFISHEDLGSPAAGDMMRLRVLRDYDHVSNTDDLQLHNVALWQKNADTA